MSQHHAHIHWRAGASGFRRGRFSRTHQWSFDGGLQVPASASPAVVPAPYSDAAALDPEEAFIAAIASCHMMSWLHLANRAGHVVASYSDKASGELGTLASGAAAITRVILRPDIRFDDANAPDAAAQAELHKQAHELCFIANSVSCEIVIEPLG